MQCIISIKFFQIFFNGVMCKWQVLVLKKKPMHNKGYNLKLGETDILPQNWFWFLHHPLSPCDPRWCFRFLILPGLDSDSLKPQYLQLWSHLTAGLSWRSSVLPGAAACLSFSLADHCTSLLWAGFDQDCPTADVSVTCLIFFCSAQLFSPVSLVGSARAEGCRAQVEGPQQKPVWPREKRAGQLWQLVSPWEEKGPEKTPNQVSKCKLIYDL